MAEAFHDPLKDAEVMFARILLCDNANVIRGKVIHGDRWRAYLEHGVGISAAQ